MAYFSQEDKKRVAPAIKKVLKKYGVKGSLAVSNHSTLVVNIKKGELDFIEAANKVRVKQASWRGDEPHLIENGHIQVNRYHAADNAREVGEDKVADFYEELVEAMMGADWFDKSDIMTDYFHTAYYMSINVGQWNKPYELV